MKRTICYTCLSAAFAVGLSAQTPQTPSSSPAPSSSPTAQSSDSKTVTLTGCLKAGEAPGSFVLANTKIGDKASAGAPSSTGTSGSAGASAATKSLENTTVTLTGSPAGVTLGDHVGHQVQITGTPASGASSAGGAAGAKPSEPGGAMAAPAKSQPSIAVSAFSMVSGSCSM